MEVIGVFAVELFVCEKAGREALLVNEIAPRVHNTGHWTQDGCEVLTGTARELFSVAG